MAKPAATINQPASIPAMRAPAPKRDNPLTRSVAGMIGLGVLVTIVLACFVSTPWTFGRVRDAGAPEGTGAPRYDLQYKTARQIPPVWWGVEGDPTKPDDTSARRLEETARMMALERIARESSPEKTVEELQSKGFEPNPEQVRAARPVYVLGTDLLGRDLLTRVLAGGVISLVIGIAAAMISVLLGTVYGAVSGYMGGRVDSAMMRIVDILYALPTVLLVVLLAIASEEILDQFVSRQSQREAFVHAGMAEAVRAYAASNGTTDLSPTMSKIEFQRVVPDADAKLNALDEEAAKAYPSRDISEPTQNAYRILTLLVAIGGVSWLTMARVVRGQVLSLKNQPFMEAARAMGVPVSGLFLRHLLPNLVGPITVYATLTVPQAILQESFLSFLGIGVKAPMPSWGNLAAEGLLELNPFKSHWWLLLFPCLALGITLLALNFVGEGLREALDPKRARK
jgi:ABC-type dipeptide/oligopeptide/nickel transport system permease subunit